MSTQPGYFQIGLMKTGTGSTTDCAFEPPETQSVVVPVSVFILHRRIQMSELAPGTNLSQTFPGSPAAQSIARVPRTQQYMRKFVVDWLVTNDKGGVYGQ